MFKKLALFTLIIFILASGAFTFAQSPITILDLYDNTVYQPGLQANWGFSCLITGTEKTILFDTGQKGSILMSNLKKLGVDPHQINIVYLSHLHNDHTGGLSSFLSKNPNITLYIPQSFLKDKGFAKIIKKYSPKVIPITGPQEICNNVFSTGEMGTQIIEQSLILQTPKGLTIITGCAHPGILKILAQAPTIAPGDIQYVFGGFHLLEQNRASIQEVVKEFQNSGVRYVSPTHCTGELPIEIFQTGYQTNFIATGVGKTISLEDIK